MDLRSLTRETEESRRITPRDNYETAASLLSSEQMDLAARTDDVIDEIIALPNGEADFDRELGQLRNAATAMRDAEAELDWPKTGPMTVAAETEAIEHLLEARRGSGGSGGGNQPGTGRKKGQTSASALALVGRANDALGKVALKDIASASGRSGEEPPAELRPMLDRYFESLNKAKK